MGSTSDPSRSMQVREHGRIANTPEDLNTSLDADVVTSERAMQAWAEERAQSFNQGRGGGEPDRGASAAEREESGMMERVEARFDGKTLVVAIPIALALSGGPARCGGGIAAIAQLADDPL
jgi:hypothetical protein